MAFKFIDYNRPGKGVKKENKENYGIGKFFSLTKDNIWRLISVNIFYVFCNLPVFFLLYGLSGNLNVPFQTPATLSYQAINGIFLNDATPSVFSMWNFGARLATSGYASTAAWVCFGIGALVFLTFGFSNVGMACITRNFARRTPADLAGDFFGTMKRNWKQALPLGFVDLLAGLALCFDVVYFYYNSLNSGAFVPLLFLFVSLYIGVTYMMMRFYMYTMVVTFDLKLTKILKNAFLFSMLGFKRNLMAILGIVLLLVLNVTLFMVITPIGALMPLLISFALGAFIANYAAYPNIKKFMIDPYYEQNPQPQEEHEEALFSDDVSAE